MLTTSTSRHHFCNDVNKTCLNKIHTELHIQTFILCLYLETWFLINQNKPLTTVEHLFIMLHSIQGCELLLGFSYIMRWQSPFESLKMNNIKTYQHIGISLLVPMNSVVIVIILLVTLGWLLLGKLVCMLGVCWSCVRVCVFCCWFVCVFLLQRFDFICSYTLLL